MRPAFFDIGLNQRLALEDLEIQSSTIAYFIVDIVQAPVKKSQQGNQNNIQTIYLLNKTLMLRFKLSSGELAPNLAKLVTAAARTVAFSKTTRL